MHSVRCPCHQCNHIKTYSIEQICEGLMSWEAILWRAERNQKREAVGGGRSRGRREEARKLRAREGSNSTTGFHKMKMAQSTDSLSALSKQFLLHIQKPQPQNWFSKHSKICPGVSAAVRPLRINKILPYAVPGKEAACSRTLGSMSISTWENSGMKWNMQKSSSRGGWDEGNRKGLCW